MAKNGKSWTNFLKFLTISSSASRFPEIPSNEKDSGPEQLWYSGFWASKQPNPQSGECVDVALTDDRQTWELTTCESLLPFMCRANACPAGNYFSTTSHNPNRLTANVYNIIN